ncbi:MAG: Flagellar basal body protein [Eubacteriales bacterium]|jgi:flagellar hook protein FlgE
MSTGMYCGISGVKAYQTGIDVIGNNIANVNTYGFKASRVTYRDVFYQTLASSSKPDATNSIGGANPSQVGYGATAATIDVLNTRAGMATTGNSKDCYINGEGYFVVKDGDGYLYTRVGSFGFDGDGNLVDGNKKLVCGTNGETKPTDAISSCEPIKVADYSTYKNISIGSDGAITGEKEGKIVTLGYIALANVPNPSGLTQQGGSYYKAENNVANDTYPIKYYTPGVGETGSLVTSALEASNTDLATELTQMIINERGFQANTKIITVSDEMMETLVNMKR